MAEPNFRILFVSATQAFLCDTCHVAPLLRNHRYIMLPPRATASSASTYPARSLSIMCRGGHPASVKPYCSTSSPATIRGTTARQHKARLHQRIATTPHTPRAQLTTMLSNLITSKRQTQRRSRIALRPNRLAPLAFADISPRHTVQATIYNFALDILLYFSQEGPNDSGPHCECPPTFLRERSKHAYAGSAPLGCGADRWQQLIFVIWRLERYVQAGSPSWW